MTEDNNLAETKKENTDKDLTNIGLALDPNLISLIDNPSGKVNNAVDINMNNDTDANMDSKGQAKSNASESLVNNPYDEFGNLPLSQFIPIVLKQRGIKFSELTEDYLLQQLALHERSNSIETKEQAHQEDIKSDGISSLSSSLIAIPNAEVHIDKDSNTVDFINSTITVEQFQQFKKEIYESVTIALNESSLSLELVSLLLSSVRRQQGMSTMSPLLKKNVPIGSLTADKINTPRVTSHNKEDQDVVRKGWKLRSLKQSQELLKSNFEKLSEIVKREQNYWSNLSNNITEKDVIFKMRDKNSGEKALAIKYGYTDSGSDYRMDRGIALLVNKNDTNNSYYSSTQQQRHNLDRGGLDAEQVLELIPFGGSTTNYNKFGHYVRVRIFDKLEEESDYILTGESRMSESFLALFKGSNNTVKNQISILKFSIFERELMYQLSKEVSDLFQYDCSLEHEKKIVAEVGSSRFEIELLPIDLDFMEAFHQEPPKTNDKKADIIADLLRMLLVVMFKKKLLKNRTEQPLLTREGPISSLYSSSGFGVLLLRPIIGKIRHYNYFILLKKIITDCILELITDSKILEETNNYKSFNYSKYTSNDPSIDTLAKEIHIFDPLIQIPRSEVILSINEYQTLKFVLTSSNYCNALIELTESVGDVTTFTEFKVLEEYLNFSVSRYLSNKVSL
ncbi:related to Mediator of RNA polymerase II transcription subunit 17 [Saccharomycodes ludwigii]|uniref:Mediator of RNA polymerase II transcription subunit 17 n=1 Tax=Saccharomycodes ludwigii TaxID=36035 RepID=A0A376B4W9_9ASCO|nr:hypothetical protein SCDLUD_000056 [Saccharomycodes ludwigii]KAH3902479.1 hypothetical protein SCDLUD_000056 [Saccharomycodes ludwigii]SSD59703.1 related to Mediator of RNA polymerase II transcription subunit 17 [Saccharomycodes ludwigii]